MSEVAKFTAPSCVALLGTALVGIYEVQDLLFRRVRDGFPEPIDLFRRRVASLIAARDDFPEPFGQIASGEIWLRNEVEAWIGEHSNELAGLLTAA
jgi:hypothetical protein